MLDSSLGDEHCLYSDRCIRRGFWTHLLGDCSIAISGLFDLAVMSERGFIAEICGRRKTVGGEANVVLRMKLMYEGRMP